MLQKLLKIAREKCVRRSCLQSLKCSKMFHLKINRATGQSQMAELVSPASSGLDHQGLLRASRYPLPPRSCVRARFISWPVPPTPVWCLQARHLAEDAAHTTTPTSLHVADPIHIYYDLIPPPAVLSSCFTRLEPPDCPVRLITTR